MSKHTPSIEFENLPAPSAGFLVTHFTVRSVAAEIRCYMQDPDGYLIEVGQSTGGAEPHRESPQGQPLSIQTRSDR